MEAFKLRSWQHDDLPSLVKYGNNINIAKNLTNAFPFPYTEEAGKAFISFAIAPGEKTIFAIEVDGEAVGGIGIHPQYDIFSKNAELGYWLAEPFWGKGIISKAISKVVDHAFEHYDITRIFARPFGSNIGSQRVLEKNNFQLEARFKKTIFKNGVFEDELVYAIRKAQ
ncbi:MAG: GNAT family N-acetyltransferase [Saprospiraceae bacterium]|nr:GNAT family N-acetyltransferase [Saprospiraceae bacterium]